MKRTSLNHGFALAGGIAGWLMLANASFAVTPTPYIAPGFTYQTLTALGTSVGGVAYAPNGTLYVVESSFSSPLHTIEVYNSDGTLGTPINVLDSGAFDGFGAIGGVAWGFNSQTDSLLVTESNNGANYLYSIPVTGPVVGGQINVVPTSLINDPNAVPDIAQVIARPNGDVFVSDAAGGAGLMGPGAGIFQISGGNANSVLSTSQDFTGGIGFNSSGQMIYQSGAFDFSGGAQTSTVTTVGNPAATINGAASYDLAVTSGNHVLLSGIVPQTSDGGTTPNTFGLFAPDLLTKAPYSLFSYPTASPYDYGESIAYHAGSTDFAPNSGTAGGQMAVVMSDYSGSTGAAGTNFVVLITPTPEPGTALLAAIGLVLLGVGVKLRR